MIKLLIIGVWACVVTLGSSYVVFSMSAPEAPGSAESDFYDGLDYRSTGAITVPIIADKAVKGYILARFVYTIDGKTAAKLTVPPEPFSTKPSGVSMRATISISRTPSASICRPSWRRSRRP